MYSELLKSLNKGLCFTARRYHFAIVSRGGFSVEVVTVKALQKDERKFLFEVASLAFTSF